MKDNARSSKLNERSFDFSIVLNDNELNLFKNSRFIKVQFQNSDLDVIYIAVIMHDKDYDYENQRLKTKHYHVVLQLNRRLSLDSMIKRISDLFHCGFNQISIEKCNSLCMQTRYLLHLDDIDKEQYMPFDIESNNDELVNKYLTYVAKIKDIDDLIKLVLQFRNFKELLSRIGLENYKRYRSVILDLRKELL